MSKKKRQHRVVMVLSFDEPCTQAHAVASAKDCIHGDFYPTSLNPGDPGKMVVRTVMRLPTAPR